MVDKIVLLSPKLGRVTNLVEFGLFLTQRNLTEDSDEVDRTFFVGLLQPGLKQTFILSNNLQPTGILYTAPNLVFNYVFACEIASFPTGALLAIHPWLTAKEEYAVQLLTEVINTVTFCTPSADTKYSEILFSDLLDLEETPEEERQLNATRPKAVRRKERQ